MTSCGLVILYLATPPIALHSRAIQVECIETIQKEEQKKEENY